MVDKLSELILDTRKKSKLSRDRLAMLSGISKTVIYDIEHGKQTVQWLSIQKVCRVLNIKIEFKSPFEADGR